MARIEPPRQEVNRIVAGVCPPDEIMTRLRRTLGVALKARQAGSVSALRSAMSAIGNAEAVDPAASRPGGTGSPHFAGTVAGLGAGEARRRRLTEADVVAIVRREAAEREAAAKADPAVRAGRLTVQIMTWYCPPGTMGKPGRAVTV